MSGKAILLAFGTVIVLLILISTINYYRSRILSPILHSGVFNAQ